MNTAVDDKRIGRSPTRSKGLGVPSEPLVKRVMPWLPTSAGLRWLSPSFRVALAGN